MMKVFKSPCKNCLLSKDRIVSPQRAKEMIESCKSDQTHFICHKASMNNQDVCCHTFYEKFGDDIGKIQIFKRLGMVEFVKQPEAEKLVPYSKFNM